MAVKEFWKSVHICQRYDTCAWAFTMVATGLYPDICLSSHPLRGGWINPWVASVPGRISRPMRNCISDMHLHICYQVINKNCCHQSCTLWLQYASNRSSAGALPQTYWGAYSAPPTPLAGLKGPYL